MSTRLDQPDMLPTTREETQRLGWDGLDILLITGDPLIDHPAFPASLLARWLIANGFRCGVISRPDPDGPDALLAMGAPRLFVGITAGALDSMVANYTANKKRRHDDPYAPHGKGGGRPDRALTVYGNLARRAFGKSLPVIAGGLEASLRRFAHYDYWSNKVRRSVLMDCGADLLIHGMGEGPLLEIARRLDAFAADGADVAACVASLQDVPGVVWRSAASEAVPKGFVELPDSDAVARDAMTHARAFQLTESNPGAGFSQTAGGMRVNVNPPWQPIDGATLDRLYALPFSRDPHPIYGDAPIPALAQVRFSVVAHRGCFGGCAFCAIGAHQGKLVQSRSEAAILSEIRGMCAHSEFHGVVNDIGGPTANMYGLHCTKDKPCKRPSCLAPSRCPHLKTDATRYKSLLDKARNIPGVRHLFVTSGLRHDLLMQQPELLDAIVQRHTSGHFKTAPEHTQPSVLKFMRKPAGDDFAKLLRRFRDLTHGAPKKRHIVPYLMAAHPGARMEDMVELALFLKRHRLRAEQCQIFTPTPGTAATVMYATGLDPATLKPVFVERDPRRRDLQKALILYHLPEQRAAIKQALKLAGRPDAEAELLGSVSTGQERNARPADSQRRGKRPSRGKARKR